MLVWMGQPCWQRGFFCIQGNGWLHPLHAMPWFLLLLRTDFCPLKNATILQFYEHFSICVFYTTTGLVVKASPIGWVFDPNSAEKIDSFAVQFADFCGLPPPLRARSAKLVLAGSAPALNGTAQFCVPHIPGWGPAQAARRGCPAQRPAPPPSRAWGNVSSLGGCTGRPGWWPPRTAAARRCSSPSLTGARRQNRLRVSRAAAPARQPRICFHPPAVPPPQPLVYSAAARGGT